MMEHWLKQLREEAGLSQDDLAARLQLEGQIYSRSAVGSWERGKTVPLKNPDFVQALASILRVTENQIMLMAGYNLSARQHTHISERIANIVDDLPQDKQEMVLRIVQAIVK